MGRRKFPEIENDHGMLVVKGTTVCLGYLWAPEGHGVWEPNFGRCPETVTKEMCETHNKLLDQALVTGLDENCQVGQGGMFYLSQKDDGTYKVATFLGTLISDQLHGMNSRFYYFTRKGREYRGTLRPSCDLTHVKRIK